LARARLHLLETKGGATISARALLSTPADDDDDDDDQV